MPLRLLYIVMLLMSSIPNVYTQAMTCAERFQSFTPISPTVDSDIDQHVDYSIEMAWYSIDDCILIASDKGLLVYNLESLQEPILIANAERAINNITVNPSDGTIAFNIGQESIAYVIDANNALSTFEATSDAITDLSLSPDGQYLAIASSAIYDNTANLFVDGVIAIWDLNSHKLLMTLSDSVSAINAMAFHKGSTELFWAGNNFGFGSVESELWNILQVDKPQKVFHVYDFTFNLDSPSFEFYPILVEAIDLQNSILAIGGLAEYKDYDNYYGYDIQIWDTNTKEMLWDTRIKDSNEVRAGETGTSLALNPDGTLLAVGLTTGMIQIWNVETGHLLTEFQSHDTFVSQLLFSSDSSYLAVVGIKDDERRVRIWDVTNLNQILILSDID